jgi:pilus assembly protein TadC
MSEIAIHFIFLISAASAGFFTAFVMLNSVAQIGARLAWLRVPAWKRYAWRAATDGDASRRGRDEVDRIPWDRWRLVAGLSGVAVLLAALWGTEYVIFAIFGLAAGFIPSIVRSQMKENARWRLRLEIRDFVGELRLARALNVTVSQALEHLTERSRDATTPFALSVRHHVERTLRMNGPEAMLQQLADEFDSKDLRKLLTLMRAALRGGMPLTDALAQSAESIAQGIRADAELSIEEAPTKLILPMLLTLFPTIIVVALIPAVALLLTSLSGTPGQP